MKSLLFLGLFVLIFTSCSNIDSGTEVDKDVSHLIGIDTTPLLKTSSIEDVKQKFSVYVKAVDSLDVFDGMLEIKSKNQTCFIGDTNVEDIDFTSSNMFEAKFGYNFYIDEKEITQADYYAIMDDSTNLPPSYATRDGSDLIWTSMAQPVGNLTLFDAIQFCNKRSKLKGLDSVYTIDGDKNSFTVTIDYSKNGYSLPTSVEWEYVAKKVIHADTSNAYQSDKYLVFGSKSEPLSTRELEPLNGLYGFFGNLKEICLSNFSEHDTDSLFNAGINHFSSTTNDEYTVMGGSYKTGMSKIDPSYRQYIKIDNQLEDIGMRCVIRVGNTSKESKLIYVPIFDTTVTIDTLVGLPVVLDTNLKIDTNTIFDTTTTIDTNNVVKKIH